MTGEILWIWFDHPNVGCGWRLWIVTHVGDRWITIFQPGALFELKVEAKDLRKARPATIEDASPTRLRRLIKRSVKERKRLTMRYSEHAVERALQAIS